MWLGVRQVWRVLASCSCSFEGHAGIFGSGGCGAGNYGDDENEEARYRSTSKGIQGLRSWKPGVLSRQAVLTA